MTIHPHQLRSVVLNHVEEIQRAADRHRLPAEMRTRVGLRRRLRRWGGTDARPVEHPQEAQALLLAFEESLRGSVIAGGDCRLLGERRFELAPETKPTGPDRTE